MLNETSFTCLKKLISFLEIDEINQKKIFFNSHFPLNLPFRLAKKIKKNDLSDPIFLQFVPLTSEKLTKKGFSLNPTKEEEFQENNFLQKYQNRALLLCSNSCAMNCRFCFRRNLKYKIIDSNFNKELSLIKKRENLSEIILSGGDPLLLNLLDLENLLKNLDSINHIKRIRFHTRLLTAFPEMIDEKFLQILSKIKKQIIFVLHVNHLNELDDAIFQAIEKIQKLNIPFLSQTVLLKKVNDSTDTLLNLFEALSNNAIFPYYLHQLDKIENSSHFEVPVAKGKKIIEKLRSLTSGYNIPSYVQEIPHRDSKIPIL